MSLLTPTWRHRLVEWPTTAAEVLYAWGRLYFAVVATICATAPLVAVISLLLLWFGFGIRWGW